MSGWTDTPSLPRKAPSAHSTSSGWNEGAIPSLPLKPSFDTWGGELSKKRSDLREVDSFTSNAPAQPRRSSNMDIDPNSDRPALNTDGWSDAPSTVQSIKRVSSPGWEHSEERPSDWSQHRNPTEPISEESPTPPKVSESLINRISGFATDIEPPVFSQVSDHSEPVVTEILLSSLEQPTEDGPGESIEPVEAEAVAIERILAKEFEDSGTKAGTPPPEPEEAIQNLINPSSDGTEIRYSQKRSSGSNSNHHGDLSPTEPSTADTSEDNLNVGFADDHANSAPPAFSVKVPTPQSRHSSLPPVTFETSRNDPLQRSSEFFSSFIRPVNRLIV